MWNTKKDLLSLKFNIDKDRKLITRRDAASVLVLTYDPFGITLPATITGRILMQQICKTLPPSEKTNKTKTKKDINKEWNVDVDPCLAEKLQCWYVDMKYLEEIKIPRYITLSNKKITLFGFSDSSQYVYGCCIYLQMKDNQNIITNLISAKAKVVPLGLTHIPLSKRNSIDAKSISIPRSELLGTKLLAEEIHFFKNELIKNEFEEDVKCFTDSTIALSWIKNKSLRNCSYVINRVEKILETTKPSEWYYVNTKKNIADLVTRGCLASELLNNKIWFKGPDFINVATLELDDQNILEEAKNNLKINIKVINILPSVGKNFQIEEIRDETVIIKICELHNSLEKSIRVIGMLQKLIRKDSTMKYVKAKLTIIKAYQQQSFPELIKKLRKNELITKPPYAKLRPFLDSNGIVRVRTRLNSEFMPYSFAKPIFILPIKIPENKKESDE